MWWGRVGLEPVAGIGRECTAAGGVTPDSRSTPGARTGGTDPGCAGKSNNGVFSIQEDAMDEVDRWVPVPGAARQRAHQRVVLYGALGDDSGKLHDELSRLRAEIRCLADPDDCDVARVLSEIKSRR